MADTKISNYTPLKSVASDDELVIVDKSDTTMAASGTTKKITRADLIAGLASRDYVLDVASALNPVGTIREFNVSTNPATLLGFGTWEAFGTGKVTVAIDAEQTEFDTVEKTGGEKTHLLTSGESGVPAHNHNVLNCALTATGDHYFASGTNYGENDARTSSNNTAANASSAHNNLQPYIVVYRWVRVS